MNNLSPSRVLVNGRTQVNVPDDSNQALAGIHPTYGSEGLSLLDIYPTPPHLIILQRLLTRRALFANEFLPSLQFFFVKYAEASS